MDDTTLWPVRRRHRRFPRRWRPTGKLPLLGLIAALAPFGPNAAFADALETWRVTPAHQAALRRVVAAYEEPRAGGCPGFRILGARATELRPIRLSADGRPIAGAWRETLLVERCGVQIRHNVLFSVENGAVTPLGMAPGETRTPQADQDAVATVAVSLLNDRAPTPDCRRFVITDTAASGPDPGTRRPWRETWMIDRCGRRDEVRFSMRLTADGRLIAQPAR